MSSLVPLMKTVLAHLLQERQRQIKQSWAPGVSRGEGSSEEEQTTNKVHSHYPLCILLLIGVADSCLLIRKGSGNT